MINSILKVTMSLKKSALLLMIFGLCQGSFCQSGEPAKETGSAIEEAGGANPSNLAKARFQINDIKTRGIIMRMKTNQDRITAYRKDGYSKVADKLQEQARSNAMLLEYAFITEWSYCSVYFMESQNTLKLLQQDTLIARSYDLQRDTAIYMNHDSFYLVDFGEMMGSTFDEDHPFKSSHESNSPVAGNFLVVKDQEQMQLQAPMPYFSKIWLEEFINTDKIQPLEIPGALRDTVNYYLAKYPNINDLLKSEAKGPVKKYLQAIFDHVNIEPKTGNGLNGLQAGKNGDGAYGATTVSSAKGNPYQIGAKRLNKYFIAYYCKRLDKDRNIISNDDPLYWWLKNPNIPYLPYLRDLEKNLKYYLDKNPSPMK